MKKLFVLISFLALSGCSTVMLSSEGTGIDKSKLSSLKLGETSRQDVVDSFGPPSETQSVEGGEKIVYTFKARKAPTFFFGVIQNDAGALEESTILEVNIKDGVVESYKYKSTEK